MIVLEGRLNGSRPSTISATLSFRIDIGGTDPLYPSPVFGVRQGQPVGARIRNKSSPSTLKGFIVTPESLGATSSARFK